MPFALTSSANVLAARRVEVRVPPLAPRVPPLAPRAHRQPHPISPGWTVDVGSGMATPAQTPTGKGFDSYLGYFDGFNDYLHSWSGQPGPLRPSALPPECKYRESLHERVLVDLPAPNRARKP